MLAAVPAGAELRFIGVAERDMVFKRDQLESTLADAFENAFFEEESVRIGHQGESGNLRSELPQNVASPRFCGVRCAWCGVRHEPGSRSKDFLKAPIRLLISRQSEYAVSKSALPTYSRLRAR